MSYIQLRSCWYDIIFLNLHAPTEDKSGEMKDNFYEELECILDKFPKCHFKLLGDFNVKAGRENIYNQKSRIRFYMIVLMIMWLEE
jgi:hypothetical protein